MKTQFQRGSFIYFFALPCFLGFSALGAGSAAVGLGAAGLGAILITLGFLALALRLAEALI